MNSPPAPAPTPALAGLRVVDLSRVLAGPLCAQMLADHGAQVIKVEPPGGDETRLFGPPFIAPDQAAYFGALNRGKRSIGLDLSRPAGREVVGRMLEGADVVIENFLPGTMEKWGLGYEAVLAPRHPGLIYCGISGFGADGPLGGMPGYDAVLQAMCGVMSINGTPDSGPLRVGIPVVDFLTGYNAMVGVLLAHAARERSGRGQRVEATLFDTGLSMLVPHAANWMASGKTPQRLGSAHPNISPYDRYAAADGDVFLGVVNDGQFQRFCACIERPDLAADPRFTRNPGRLENRAALRAELERTLARYPSAQLCEQLMRNGVPAGPVNDVPHALQQPHAAHRGMFVDVDGHKSLGLPVKLAANPGAPGRRPPHFSEHAQDILAELGYSAAQIEALRTEGAVLTPA
jgi:crotonobetainyl-CoA:carnitine CoA-transferase CaiB-like acyl-CoA transferase